MKKTGVMLVVFLMVLSTCIMPVFGASVPGYSGSLYKHFITSDSKVEAEVRIVNFNPYYEQFNSDYLGRTNEPKYHAIVNQDYFISFTIRNRTDQDLKTIHNYFGAITFTKNDISVPAASEYRYSFTVADNGWKIKELSDNIATIYVGGGDSSINSVQIVPQSDLYDGPYCAVPANTTVTFYMIVTRSVTWSCHCQEAGVLLSPSVPLNRSDCPVNNILYDITENAWSDSSSKVRYTPNIIAGIEDQLIKVNTTLNDIKNNQILAYAQRQNTNNYLSNIDSNVQTITDAYISNSSNITETQSNITSTDNLVSDLHDQELTYYQQNESALNDVGISNFSFDSDQSSGLGAVVNDFTTLWNNIGPLQIIFTFTLSMSLATYLLRHRPITNAIKKNEKK